MSALASPGDRPINRREHRFGYGVSKCRSRLTGLRVLELARILAGPWAGQMLADLGADVIKVERKGAGDDTRGWGPPFVEGADGKHIGSAYFHSANRGKRSIELDFESEDGRRVVRKLAAQVRRPDRKLQGRRAGQVRPRL